MQATSSPPDLAQTFAGILDGLCRAIAARMVRRPSTIPMLMLLWTRLRRATRRFATLADRAAAGPLPPPRAPRPRAARARSPRPRFPTFFGWVCHFVPSEAACYGSQLQALMSRPDMATLLDRAPQAARMLRPLCHMLAVPRPALLAPQAARTPATDPAVADRAATSLPPWSPDALWSGLPDADPPPFHADIRARHGPGHDRP